MSFFDTLKEKASEARDKLVTEVGKFKNREFMEACVAGCGLVAAADGSIDSSEKQKMMKFIQQSNELKVFDTKDVLFSTKSRKALSLTMKSVKPKL
jgi:tellurite resistance protein TerB